nr:hypothetical protein [Streptomyces composti]
MYETTFDWRPDGHDRIDLLCDGLDTVATVSVNGATVGTTANMHRSYRFDVGRHLTPGSNRLRVEFESPYTYAERLRSRLGDRPASYDEPYPFIRKMACNFGWDWGPTLVTSGIWRPITLHSWSAARLAEVRPLVSVDGADGRVDVHVAVERAVQIPLTVTAEVAGVLQELTLPPGQDQGVMSLRVPGPRLWWPRGYGEQPLYPLTVRLGDEVWTRRIGFRTMELDTAPDPAGGSVFGLRVNDRPVFVKGFNWIPDDCFPTRVTDERLGQQLGQAVDAGANLLRV